jgi:hypothetical protein
METRTHFQSLKGYAPTLILAVAVIITAMILAGVYK